MKVLTRLLCAFTACFALVALAPATSGAATTPVTVTWVSGAYVANSPSTNGINAWAAYRGHPAGIAGAFINDDSWNSIYWSKWAVQNYANFPGTITLGVPLTVVGTPLSQVASGKYDSDYISLANKLIAAGRTNIHLRLGWEFNEPSFPWNQYGAAAYIAAFRHVSSLLKSLLPSIKIDWGADWGPVKPAMTDPKLWYPGDAYVDTVTLDAYDHGRLAPTDDATFTRWVNAPYGLDDWYNFALAHNKSFAVPEWGLDKAAAGDNPSYVNDMFYWFAAHASNLAYESYFSLTTVGKVQNSLTSPVQLPLSSQAYRTAWSNGLPPTQSGGSAPSSSQPTSGLGQAVSCRRIAEGRVCS